jgi:hypothetical protein
MTIRLSVTYKSGHVSNLGLTFLIPRRRSGGTLRPLTNGMRT